MQNAVRIIDLVDCRRAFRAQTSPACRVQRVTFELANLIRLFIDVRQEPAGRFAIEARCRHQPILALRSLSWPLMRIDLHHIVPSLRPWMAAKRGIGRTVLKRRRLGNQPKIDGPAFDETWRCHECAPNSAEFSA